MNKPIMTEFEYNVTELKSSHNRKRIIKNKKTTSYFQVTSSMILFDFVDFGNADYTLEYTLHMLCQVPISSGYKWFRKDCPP